MARAQLNYSNVYNPGQVDAQDSRDFERILGDHRADGPIECANLIEGAWVRTDVRREREDPTEASRVASVAFEASPDLVDHAVRVAKRAAQEWAAVPQGERTAAMLRAARVFSERRVELAALMALEIGKTRADCLAEVDECVAILELFAHQVSDPTLLSTVLSATGASPLCTVVYRPYGVFGVIAPFNFPLALATGMAAGALITGNAVVYKPSALTPASGVAWAGILAEVVPPATLQVIHGDAEVGRLLSEAGLDGLAFTGSAAVGLELAARMIRPPYARPMIAEMGGKNPSIISSSAEDLALAARATARSAFGMTGQKCVSCSRAIVLDDVYDDFMTELVDVTSTFRVGDPIDPDVFTGPLIKQQSLERFESSVALAGSSGRIVTGGGSRGPGWYADLTIVDELPAGHVLTREELFAPILAVVRVSSLDEAINEANAVDYGLSAGLFASDPREQQLFLERIEAGIVLVNNPGGATTGIWPGSQTMAGWKGSGFSGMGGFGPYYLLQFVREQSRTIGGSA